eukprot:2283502-Rhodomonas_salina.4
MSGPSISQSIFSMKRGQDLFLYFLGEEHLCMRSFTRHRLRNPLYSGGNAPSKRSDGAIECSFLLDEGENEGGVRVAAVTATADAIPQNETPYSRFPSSFTTTSFRTFDGRCTPVFILCTEICQYCGTADSETIVTI